MTRLGMRAMPAAVSIAAACSAASAPGYVSLTALPLWCELATPHEDEGCRAACRDG
ncbi:hypothetical protein GCM10011372_16640 [Agromyces bauzanensis]|uniref:Lipoprotein n=1 Tax=Agromyces bauzanensis TaxID=1308924 RepID=A0A917PHD9_9MICO|nr:hypothetical protein GCM10011372_16640 [Agromyces bauzanensis]